MKILLKNSVHWVAFGPSYHRSNKTKVLGPGQLEETLLGCGNKIETVVTPEILPSSARKWISVMGPNGFKISARYLNALLDLQRNWAHVKFEIIAVACATPVYRLIICERSVAY